MRILYIILALFSHVSSRTLYSDSSQEVTFDLQSIKNAAQLVDMLQQMNERSSRELEEYAPPRLYKNRTPPGIDLDYMGISGEQYIDVNNLMRLVQKNYQANRNDMWNWKRMEENPRLYYISNPEVLEEYWRSISKKNKLSIPEAENRDTRNQDDFLVGIDRNLLKYIISQRRVGDGNDEETNLNLDNNRIEKKIKDDMSPEIQKHRTIDTYEPKKYKKAARGFKSKDDLDYDDESKFEKRTPKFNKKVPAIKTPPKMGRDFEDKKTIENFKSPWRMKKPSYREPIRTSRRYEEAPERPLRTSRRYEEPPERPLRTSRRYEEPPERPLRTSRRYEEPPERVRYNKISKSRFAKEGGRSKGNMGSFGGYGRYGGTPPPFIGKRGIYEED